MIFLFRRFDRSSSKMGCAGKWMNAICSVLCCTNMLNTFCSGWESDTSSQRNSYQTKAHQISPLSAWIYIVKCKHFIYLLACDSSKAMEICPRHMQPRGLLLRRLYLGTKSNTTSKNEHITSEHMKKKRMIISALKSYDEPHVKDQNMILFPKKKKNK